MAFAMISISYLPRLPVFKLVNIATICLFLAFIFLFFNRSRHISLPPSVKLPESAEGKNFQVVGTVIGVPIQSEASFDTSVTQWQFDFRVKAAINTDVDGNTLDSLKNTKIRLTWFQLPPAEASLLYPGSVLSLSAKLKAPRGFVNPVGFDYQRWLLSAGYSAIGTIKSVEQIATSSPRGWAKLTHQLSHARLQIRRHFENILNDNSMLGPMLAIALGDKSLLTDQQWQLLQTSGTVHLLIVSGLHIGLVASIGFAIGHHIAKILSLYRQRYLPALPVVLSISLACFYAALAGFSLPTQRALIMTLVANLIWLLGKHRSPWIGYWLAMVLVLMLDPLAAHGNGFWLSFFVVWAILMILPFVQNGNIVWKTTKLQLNIFVSMLIPIILATGALNTLSPLANLIAIPYVSLIVVPLALLASALCLLPGLQELTQWSVQLAAGSMWLFWQPLDWLVARGEIGELSLVGFFNRVVAQGEIATSTWVLLAMTVVFILLPILPKHLKLTSFTIFIIGVIKVPIGTPELQLTALDVGQGSANVLLIGNKTLIFDSGPQFGQSFQAASDIIAPYLDSLGKTRIESLVISHGDLDHSSGADYLYERFNPAVTHSGEPGRLPIDSVKCEAGVGWVWGEASFEFLWPISGHSLTANANDRSCVLLVQWRDQSILFTGDISKPVEWYLVDRLLNDTTVLIAPHHGSKTSSSHRFIAKLSPDHVVFSAGFNNRYRHPNLKVVRRYNELTSSAIWSTADHGAISFAWDADQKLTAYSYRDRRKRFWY